MMLKLAFRAALCCVFCTLMLACTPLIRGFSNHQFISNGFPAVTIGSPLPPITEGHGSTFVPSSNFQMTLPDYWLSVYGAGKFEAPMAIALYATAPDGYEWEPNSLIDRPSIGTELFGEQSYSVTIRSINVKKDAFAGMVLPESELKDDAPDKHWIAVRFSDMTENFWRTKIILEYREPFPSSLDPTMKPSMLIGTPELKAIYERAKQAFSVQYAQPEIAVSKAPHTTHPQLREKYLGNFIGTLKVIERLMFENDRM